MLNHQNAIQARDTEALGVTLTDDELRHVLGGGDSDPPVVPDVIQAGPVESVFWWGFKELAKAMYEGVTGPTQSGNSGNGAHGAGGAGGDGANGGDGGTGGASGR
ncbi:MAG TPA: hypothetical protein VJU61_17960 [Polyangiaceae bacterium]|nr:hypothetical protein [Polyangiaceae bacterium]